MKSKTSCFNSGIFRKNCTRFWPVWGLYLGMLFLLVPVQIYSLSSSFREQHTWYVQDALNSVTVGFSIFPVFFFSILSAAMMFSYLYNSRSCNMMHAFPLKRSQLFLTNSLSGLAFLVVPQILTALVTVPGFLRLEIPGRIMGYYLLQALGYDIIFYSIAVFCCMLAGHLLSAVAYFFILNGVYIVCKLLFTTFQTYFGYGLEEGYGMEALLTSGKTAVLSPLTYLAANSGIRLEFGETAKTVAEQLSALKVTGNGIIAGYCIIALLLLLCAFWLYHRRQLECAGEMSAFAVLDPIMRWIIAICGGMTFAFFFVEYISDSRGILKADEVRPFLFCFLIFSFICFFVAEMILKKRFRVFQKKRWLEWAGCCAAIVLLLTAIHADVFHVERYIPPVDEVKGAMISGNYSIVADEPSELFPVMELHQTILDHRKEYQEAERQSYRQDSEDVRSPQLITYLYIRYFMKDGSVVNRSYAIPVTEEAVQQPKSAISLLDSMETPESVLSFLLGPNYPEIQFTSGSFENHSFSQEETQELYAALQQDLEENLLHYRTKDTIREDWPSLVYVSLYGVLDDRERSITDTLSKEPYLGLSGNMINLEMAGMNTTKKSDGTFTTTVDISFYLNPDCMHSIEVLKKYGLVEGPQTIRDKQKALMEEGDYGWDLKINSVNE